jgi:ribosomal-protein-alanine N-acetyltransferase
MILKTERLILREVKKKDLNDLLKDMNNIKISSCLLGVPHPFKKSDAVEWINHCLKTAKRKIREEYNFCITFKGSDKMIGEVMLQEMDFEQKKAELAFWLSESHWKNGIITEAIKAVIDFAFNKLHINRLEISAFTENEGSNNLAKKLGFKYEGTRREVSIPESTKKVHDDNVYSLLKKEYKNEKTLS